jgi:hypothetical protein
MENVYRITVVVSTEEDDASRVLDAVQDRWNDIDWAGPALELSADAELAGYAVTVEDHQGGNPCDASAGDQEVDIGVAFDVLHDELKVVRARLKELGEQAEVQTSALGRGTLHTQGVIEAINALSATVGAIKYAGTQLRTLVQLESELSKACGDKS